MVGLSAFCFSSEYFRWILTCIQVGNSQRTSFSSSSGACYSVCFLYLQCWALNQDPTHTISILIHIRSLFLRPALHWLLNHWLIIYKKNWPFLCPRCFSILWKVTRNNGAPLTQILHHWDWEMSLSISEVYITACSG